jgi:predicted thioesterase
VAISTSHIKASKIGSEVRAVAKVVGVDGRKIEFEITAYDGDSVIGEAKHTRFIVDRAKFLSKLA